MVEKWRIRDWPTPLHPSSPRSIFFSQSPSLPATPTFFETHTPLKTMLSPQFFALAVSPRVLRGLPLDADPLRRRSPSSRPCRPTSSELLPISGRRAASWSLDRPRSRPAPLVTTTVTLVRIPLLAGSGDYSTDSISQVSAQRPSTPSLFLPESSPSLAPTTTPRTPRSLALSTVLVAAGWPTRPVSFSASSPLFVTVYAYHIFFKTPTCCPRTPC